VEISIAFENRTSAMKRTDPVDPWRAPLVVEQIPEIGMAYELDADQATREAMAKIAGLREIMSAHALFEVRLRSRGRVHVRGRVSARVGQTCVVTLDPIENEINEAVDLMFAPSDQIRHPEDGANDERDKEVDGADQMEPIENGVIDLGRLATDVLYLAIDAYPRKPGAVFEPRVVAADPEDHPFASLKALKPAPNKPAPKSKDTP
jgi:uncharacterized metal-binding protein YceD (DUF177 family)